MNEISFLGRSQIREGQDGPPVQQPRHVRPQHRGCRRAVELGADCQRFYRKKPLKKLISISLYQGHKLVLCTASPVFHQLFFPKENGPEIPKCLQLTK